MITLISPHLLLAVSASLFMFSSCSDSNAQRSLQQAFEIVTSAESQTIGVRSKYLLSTIHIKHNAVSDSSILTGYLSLLKFTLFL